METVLEGDASVGDIKMGPEVTSQEPLSIFTQTSQFWKCVVGWREKQIKQGQQRLGTQQEGQIHVAIAGFLQNHCH